MAQKATAPLNNQWLLRLLVRDGKNWDNNTTKSIKANNNTDIPLLSNTRAETINYPFG